jgi:hypothetical protein
MAIQDRNLAPWTKLVARYKGQTHTAEVVEKEGKPVYRLADGREFKSPSAAGTGITGLTCNGSTFWSVGDGGEKAGPVMSAKLRPAAKSTVHPAPKPQSKRARKAQTGEPPQNDDPVGASSAVDEAGDASEPAGELSTHDPADNAAPRDGPLCRVRRGDPGRASRDRALLRGARQAGGRAQRVAKRPPDKR